ncbi:flagellar hook-basal body protein [Janthinobacterium sp. GB4P2]|uniref:flagellar hook-basal body protein n=1 Tax=Janthinobacterium sp. GB4P2 TaxID=3424189 RepID=UPI003F20FC7E
MDVMAIAATAMQQDILKLDGISHNLANALTPGYKRQVMVTQQFASQMDDVRASGVALRSVAEGAKTSIDTTAATLRYTAKMQDVAIEGDGFFELAGPNGTQYTRQGSFHTDVNGRLVGAQGLPMMGVGGELVLSDAPFSIEANGDVRQGDNLIGRLKLVQFTHPDALLPSGGGMYRQGDTQIDFTAREPRLKAGFEENSNVDSAQEMVHLTATMRHFESLQKVMQGYDEVLGKAFTKLGEF